MKKLLFVVPIILFGTTALLFANAVHGFMNAKAYTLILYGLFLSIFMWLLALGFVWKITQKEDKPGKPYIWKKIKNNSTK